MKVSIKALNCKDKSAMVLVPAGTFLYGSKGSDLDIYPDELLQRAIDLPAFYMDVFPVTNSQFCKFLNDVKPNKKTLTKWIKLYGLCENERSRIELRGGKYAVPSGYKKHPVVYVTWYGANAYARWAGKRLPAKYKWEKAGITAVNEYPKGKSVYGCFDMVGNVPLGFNFWEIKLGNKMGVVPIRRWNL